MIHVCIILSRGVSFFLRDTCLGSSSVRHIHTPRAETGQTAFFLISRTVDIEQHSLARTYIPPPSVIFRQGEIHSYTYPPRMSCYVLGKKIEPCSVSDDKKTTTKKQSITFYVTTGGNFVKPVRAIKNQAGQYCD